LGCGRVRDERTQTERLRHAATRRQRRLLERTSLEHATFERRRFVEQDSLQLAHACPPIDSACRVPELRSKRPAALRLRSKRGSARTSRAAWTSGRADAERDMPRYA